MGTSNQPKGRQPDFKNDGVAVWVNLTKEGEKYLSIKLAGHNPVAAFRNKPQEKKPIVEDVV